VTQQSVNVWQVANRPVEEIEVLGLVVILDGPIRANQLRQPAPVRSDDGERIGGFSHCDELAKQ
jgi:hypothetical protein